MAIPRIDDRDWSGLTTGQRIRQLEVEGYLVLARPARRRPHRPSQSHHRYFRDESPSITANASAAAATSNSTAAKSPLCSATHRRLRSCANFWATK